MLAQGLLGAHARRDGPGLPASPRQLLRASTRATATSTTCGRSCRAGTLPSSGLSRMTGITCSVIWVPYFTLSSPSEASSALHAMLVWYLLPIECLCTCHAACMGIPACPDGIVCCCGAAGAMVPANELARRHPFMLNIRLEPLRWAKLAVRGRLPVYTWNHRPGRPQTRAQVTQLPRAVLLCLHARTRHCHVPLDFRRMACILCSSPLLSLATFSYAGSLSMTSCRRLCCL